MIDEIYQLHKAAGTDFYRMIWRSGCRAGVIGTILVAGIIYLIWISYR